MSTFNRISCLFITLPLIFCTTLSLAGGHKSGEKHARHQGMKVWLKGIELSDEQKEKIDDIKDKYQEKYQQSHKEKMLQSKQMKTQMQDLILSDKFDEAAVKSVAEKMAKEKVEKRVLTARQQNQIYNLLTPEQKAQVKENSGKYTEKMRSKDRDKMDRE